MNSTHRVNVVRIDEIHPHTNADTLGLVFIDGYQVVVKKGDYKAGDLAIYIQPDTIVPAVKQFEFLWAGKEWSDGSVPEKYRRITVRRFRKEWSEGLLIPVSEFGYIHHAQTSNCAALIPYPDSANDFISVGDDVSGWGFTHYVEPDPSYVLGTPGRKLTLWQKILKFFGYTPKPFGPKTITGAYDVESLKNYPRLFEQGEEVIVTEKIHGSNARFTFDGKTFWVGSHHRWCKDKTNIWWRVAKKYPWIEELCRDWPHAVIRGEVTPTQKSYPYAENHGDNTEERFFLFDIQRPDGTYVDKTTILGYPGIMQLVPVIYHGPYDPATIKALAEGNTLVEGAKHIREGVIVTSARERQVRGVGRAQLKLKSLKFLEKDNA